MILNKYIIVFVIISIVVIIVNISVTFIKISDFKKEFTGQVSGFVNITVNSNIAIDVPRDLIYWGQGSVNSSFLNATLYTDGDNLGVVERGNWSNANVFGFIVENIGSRNCSLYIQSGKEAHDFFISESNSNEQYMFKTTNKDTNSCSGADTIGQFVDANKTSGGTKHCKNFGFDRNHNEIYIDVLLTIPKDANKLGEQSDNILVIGSSVE